MRLSLKIAKRDFLGLFGSSFYWVLVGLSSLLLSAAFIRTVLSFIAQQTQVGGGNIHLAVVVSHISWVNMILLFVIPSITMRLIAEEKKQRSFDLLLTLPIKSHEIAIGKTLAAFFSASIIIFISMLYLLMLSFMTEVNFGPLFSSYVGLFLLTLIYSAVGVFCSSITTSTILSAILAITFNISLFILNGVGQSIEGKVLSSVVTHLEIVGHFSHFLKGVLSVPSLVLLLSISVFFIYLTHKSIETVRWK